MVTLDYHGTLFVDLDPASYAIILPEQVARWCAEHLSTMPKIVLAAGEGSQRLRFADQDDATMFALRWRGCEPVDRWHDAAVKLDQLVARIVSSAERQRDM